MTKIRGVILDVDGTLVDSNDAHTRSWLEAMAEKGHTNLEYGKVRGKIGMGGDKLLPDVLGIEKDTPEGKEISARRGQIFKRRYLNGLQPFPGARRLIEVMREHGLKIAIASSAEKDELQSLLQVVGATDLIEEETSSADTKQSKPDPNIVQITLERMQLPPEEVIMLGDTAYDIEAARKAGVQTISLRCGGWKDQDLKGALAIYNDPEDLLNHYDHSPLGERFTQQS